MGEILRMFCNDASFPFFEMNDGRMTVPVYRSTEVCPTKKGCATQNTIETIPVGVTGMFVFDKIDTQIRRLREQRFETNTSWSLIFQQVKFPRKDGSGTPVRKQFAEKFLLLQFHFRLRLLREANHATVKNRALDMMRCNRMGIWLGLASANSPGLSALSVSIFLTQLLPNQRRGDGKLSMRPPERQRLCNAAGNISPSWPSGFAFLSGLKSICTKRAATACILCPISISLESRSARRQKEKHFFRPDIVSIRLHILRCERPVFNMRLSRPFFKLDSRLRFDLLPFPRSRIFLRRFLRQVFSEWLVVDSTQSCLDQVPVHQKQRPPVRHKWETSGSVRPTPFA